MSTTTSNPASPPTAPARRSRRWWRIVLVIIVALVAIPFAIYWYSVYSTARAWEVAVEEAERDFPRWRLLELDEDRPEIPDAENSALHMIKVLRQAGSLSIGGGPAHVQIFEELPPTADLNAQQANFIRDRFARIQGPLAEARKLKDMPRGRFTTTYSNDYISTLITPQQDARQFADALSHDAFLLAHEREFDRAVESAQAILNVGRALDGELTLIGNLIGIAIKIIHTTTLERVLAQTGPGEGPSDETLRTLQTLLEKDSAESPWLKAVRGERAGWHHLFENVKSGKLAGTQLRGLFSPRANSFSQAIDSGLAEAFPTTMLRYYPDFLHHMNQCVEAAKLPFHERQPKLQALENKCRDTGNLLVRSLAPSLLKVSQADARGQAAIRSALVAIACERYRVKTNAWPKSLDVLVQDKLLKAVPADPFDNEPIRFARTKEGIVIYSIGTDLKDDGGAIGRLKSDETGTDIGFRLWNVDQRRQTPRPPVVLEK